jgi:urease accessory protein UreE
MKQIIALILAVSVLSCKNTNSESLTTLKGDYIFFDDAAVLQSDNQIYGVFLNAKSKELNKRAAAFKTNNTDMIKVELTGIVSTKKDSVILWENKLEIIDIIAVSTAKNKKTILNLGTE